jgi:hypothetical protein
MLVNFVITCNLAGLSLAASEFYKSSLTKF